MKRYLFAILLFLLPFAYLSAQDAAPATTQPQGPSFRERLFFGGNLGLNFGSLTYIQVSPLIGYRITEKLGAGLGPSYSYFSDNRDKNYKYSTNTYGGRLFGQYRIHESIMLYSEFEVINIEIPDPLSTRLVRENVSSLFVGGGYIQRMGRSSAISLSLLYNVLEGNYPIYENPLFRTGFMFGF